MRMSVRLAASLAALLLAAPVAIAGVKDRVHADSFGNLVIHSPAGYKRIIVGMGHVAGAYHLTGSYYEPEDLAAMPDRALRCHRPPHVWHGRSHMYGLAAGKVPQAPLVCR